MSEAEAWAAYVEAARYYEDVQTIDALIDMANAWMIFHRVFTA
jgi:hypothetical protein